MRDRPRHAPRRPAVSSARRRVRPAAPAAAVAAVVLAAFLARSAAAADGTLGARDRYPVEGAATELVVRDAAGAPVAGAWVRATYRPGSRVSFERTVGRTDADGRVSWTPQTAGIVTLAAEWDGGGASANVSVRFRRPSVTGIAIMVVAGLLLVGGSVRRVARIVHSIE